jgi:hypothetical protein
MSIGSPVDYFNIGRAGGAAKSPAIGMAIKNIVAQGDSIRGSQQQAFAQGLASVPGAIISNQLKTSPKPVYVYDYLTGELMNMGDVPGNADVTIPAFSEGTVEGMARLDRLRKKTRTGTAVPTSTTDYLGSAAPSAAPAQSEAPAPAPLQPRGLGPSGVSTSVINSPEAQALLQQIIREKMSGGM